MEDGEKDKRVFVCNKSGKNAQQKYIKHLVYNAHSSKHAGRCRYLGWGGV
jgi:hypothetical protein